MAVLDDVGTSARFGDLTRYKKHKLASLQSSHDIARHCLQMNLIIREKRKDGETLAKLAAWLHRHSAIAVIDFVWKHC